jgi:hypothetical protein
VPCTEDVILAFLSAQEPTQAAELANSREPLTPAANQFMRVSLMASVPNDPVLRRIENVVERKRQLDGAECRSKMATDLRHDGYDFFSHFPSELVQLVDGKAPEVARIFNSIQQARHVFWVSSFI